MRFINLTPHTIVVFNGEAEEKTFPSEGCARVEQFTKCVDVIDNIPIYRSEIGAVEGLPPQENGVLYIVSAVVKATSPRVDLVSPGRLVRDSEGRVIGCEGFIH